MDDEALKRIEIALVDISHRFKSIEKPILFIKNFLIFILKYKGILTKAIFVLLGLWYLEHYKKSMLIEVDNIVDKYTDKTVVKVRYSIKKALE